ncbi:uncharacterized protein LOC120929125 [Rana temporaria]|uniref:uncharacterized protein LOC120929125 n=1 Tax=Rana temporaria TaxID=8407 RepID=UPI001AADBC59|nr:uncharacterized protein LOC120929125 [Rana temporaria]
MYKIQSSQNSADITEPELDRAFVRLQRLLEKKVRVFWHKHYFSKYCENHITPWGLRIQIFPNLKKIDDSLKTEWEDNLQTCSFGMMHILCKQYEGEITDLDLQINTWYIDLILAATSPLFIQREKELKEHLEEYTADLIKIKEGKYMRDKSAYDNKYAYKWTPSTFARQPAYQPTRNVPPNTSNIPNMSSVSSAASSQSTVYRDLSQNQLPKKRKSNRKSASSDSLSRTGSTITRQFTTNSSTLDNIRSFSRLPQSGTPQVASTSSALLTRALPMAPPFSLSPTTTPTRRSWLYKFWSLVEPLRKPATAKYIGSNNIFKSTSSSILGNSSNPNQTLWQFCF